MVNGGIAGETRSQLLRLNYSTTMTIHVECFPGLNGRKKIKRRITTRKYVPEIYCHRNFVYILKVQLSPSVLTNKRLLGVKFTAGWK
jgi:hypothetical protein